MQDFLARNAIVIPAIVTGVVGFIVGILTTLVAPYLKHRLDKRFLKYKLTMDYDYEQRKKLREQIGRYHGHLIQAAENLDDRIHSLYRRKNTNWLKVDGNYARPGDYYFRTIVYRFLAFYAVIRQFEEENLFVDIRIAEEQDLALLKYLRALRWVVSGTDLFPKAFEYDPNGPHLDHIYSDRLREAADACLKNGKFLTPTDFQSRLKMDQSSDGKLDQVLKFFDGLKPAEDHRYRWDRIVALHLLLKGFLDRFGYDYQKLTDDAFAKVYTEIQHQEVFDCLVHKLDAFNLDKTSEVKRIKRWLSEARQNTALT